MGASRKDYKVQTASVSSGAKQRRTKVSEVFSSYCAHHKTSLISSFGRLIGVPLQTLMTSLVVAIALALPAILLVVLDNMEQLGDSWDADPKISVYLHPRARENAIVQLREELESYPEIRDVVYLSADDALREFEAFSGFGEVLSALDENPLPATLVISLNDPTLAPSELKRVSQKIAQESIVDEVSLDMDWVKRLQELMVLGKKMVLALASLLGLGVLLAIGNTIRLAIENRRDEILVSKLVGGTNGFVRRPFLYSGAWYGFFGGILAALIVSIGVYFLSPTVDQLALLYESRFQLTGMGFRNTLILVGVSTLLGLFGAWLAVGRHLSEIQPR